MSWWTEIRDGIETAAGIVLNYYYPGTAILGNWVNSKGSYNQLYNTDWGKASLLIGGIAGGLDFGSADGTVGTAGNTFATDYLGGTGGQFAEGAAATGAGSFGTSVASGIDQNLVDAAQLNLSQGMTPMDAIKTAGLSPAQANAAGLTAPAGTTWESYAQQSGVPYTNGAEPTFSGQQGTAGSFGSNGGSLTGGPTGSSPYGTGYNGGASSAAASSAKSTGSMPWGSPGNVATVGQGLLGLYQSEQLKKQAALAAQQADPFGPQRAGYAQRLNDLVNNPDSVSSLPGYQAGLKAVQRSMAAQGYTGSGNMMTALQKYGGDFYNQAMDRYASLAGAQFNPANAAQLGLQGNMASLNLMGNSLNRMGYGTQMAGNTWPWQNTGQQYPSSQGSNTYNGGNSSVWG